MENFLESLTLSAFQTIGEHNHIENTTRVPKDLHTANGMERSRSLNIVENKPNKEKSSKEESSRKSIPKQFDDPINSTATKPKNGGASNVSSGNHKMPDVSRRKMRERLIHFLALKPSKEFEIYARLQNEGIREVEELLVGSILSDIALLRDNVYSLKRHIWNEVNEKWPYYAEQEQQQLKLFKTRNLSNPSSSNGISSTTSARLLIQGKANLKTGFKRRNLEYGEPQAAKRRHITHATVDNRDNTGSTNSEKNARHHTTNNRTPTSTHLQSNINNSSNGSKVNTAKEVERHPGNGAQPKLKNNPHKEPVPQITPKLSIKDTHKKKQHNNPVLERTSKISDIQQEPVFHSTSEVSRAEHTVIEKIDTDTPSYDFSSYSAVESVEQRRQYKYVFDRHYEEYLPLLRRVEEVRHIFRVLPEQLRYAPEGSSEYKRIEDQIKNEYKKLNTKEEIQLKRRFDYLEAKLIHIRKRVDEFDERLLAEKAVQAAVAAAKEYRLQERQQSGQP